MVAHKVLPTLKGLIKKGNYVLLLKKRATKEHEKVMYDLPGGHVCFGEDIASCLQRTIKEDVNLIVEISKPINAWTIIRNNQVEIVGTTFLCNYKGGTIKLKPEYESYEWISIKDIKKGNYPDWVKDNVSKIKSK